MVRPLTPPPVFANGDFSYQQLLGVPPGTLQDFARPSPAAWLGISDAGRLLRGYIGQALRDTGQSLTNLPVEVAQQILTSRAESMQQFFETWSRSIRENAKLDDKANKQKILLARVLNLAVNAGDVTEADAATWRGRAGLPSVEAQRLPPRRLEAERTVHTSFDSGLRPPTPRRPTNPQRG
jgi:hypothetical protein